MIVEVDEKVKLNRFNFDRCRPHVYAVDPDCGECVNICADICPAGAIDVEKGIVKVDYRYCLECGACVFVCEKDNIKFEYPPKGYGIIHSYG